jgi:ABC-type Fe3+/spermidine/putrescine transport system ATPase subunit
MTASCFELRSVCKGYRPVQALCDISFRITAGEHLAVLGPSGSGKSTLLQILAGLETPDAGSVLLNGVCISEPGKILLAPHRRGISLVFQDLALWPNLTAQDNVMLGLSGLSLRRAEVLERTHEALSLCGIEELAHRKPGAMSGGQQQRVALARAVAVRPAFLLMDEPYAGLDLVLKSRLLPEVRDLAALQDMTLILVTHDPQDAIALCHNALVLDRGRIAEAGPLTELLEAPRSELLHVFQNDYVPHRSRISSYRTAAPDSVANSVE